MATLQDILGYFMSGEGRLIAAAILFLLMWVLKKVPVIGPWLDKDSGKLTSKRKKMLANIVLAMGPTAFMLTTDAALSQVLTTGASAALIAAGFQSNQKAALAPPADK